MSLLVEPTPDGAARAVAPFLSTFISGESVVAIRLPRASEHLYIAQLAALKAGAAYTCIDPIFPDEQVRDILNDSEAVALLTDDDGFAVAGRVGFDREQVFNVAELIAQ